MRPSPFNKYGLIVVLAALGLFVLYAKYHPRNDQAGQATAPAAASVPAAATAAGNGLPELTGNIPVTPDAKAVYHVDAAITPEGNQIIPGAGTATVTAHKGEPLVFAGWAVDKTVGKAAAGVAIVIDNSVKIPAAYGGVRADVATALNSPAFAPSAFSVSIPPADLPAGRHEVRFLILSADRSHFALVTRPIAVVVR